jgi:hypothetical protein
MHRVNAFKQTSQTLRAGIVVCLEELRLGIAEPFADQVVRQPPPLPNDDRRVLDRPE